MKDHGETKESIGTLLEKGKNPLLIQVMALNSNLSNVEVGNVLLAYYLSGRCIQVSYLIIVQFG